MRTSWRAVLGLTLAAAVLLPGHPAGAGSGCALSLEKRNQWYQLTSSGAVAEDDADPCHLLAVGADQAVRSSTDGGLSWTGVGSAPTTAGVLVASGFAPGTVALAGAKGGLWTTADWGHSWTAATGVTGTVSWLSVDERDRTHVLVVAAAGVPAPALPGAGSAAATPTLLVSNDGGHSFQPVPGAAGLPVTSVATDPANPGFVWLGVGSAAGGLFLSTDGGTTFLQKQPGDVRAVATSRLAGGGAEVVAASSAGFFVSRDGGTTIATHSAGADVRDLTLEWDHPSALMAVTADGAVRSADTGSTVRPAAGGLAAGCQPAHLRRDRSVPSVFLVSCADGGSYRYRSDGTDLSAIDNPDGSGPPLPGVGVPLTTTPMQPLTRQQVAVASSPADGSIAFDGTDLYYADLTGKGVVHRQVSRTGKALPDLQTGVPQGLLQLAYDANRNHLIVTDAALYVWDVPLSGGPPRRLFLSPAANGVPNDPNNSQRGGFAGSMTYDAATDRLLFASDGASGWVEYDQAGQQVAACPQALTSVSVSGATTGTASIAGIVATGDGQVYVETEDDQTVLRMDRSCHVVAAFSHDPFSEAGNENDSLACDTTSFPVPAVWMRDARAGVFAAYSVPSGYCALPTTLSVAAPASVSTGHSGPVCATLRLKSTGRPLPGEQVDVLVAGRGIGRPRTSAAGVACASYVPLAGDAGPAAPAASTKAGHNSRANQPVLAAYLGTPAYRPSQASRLLEVDALFPPLPVQPVPPRLAVLPPPAHAVVAPPPALPVQPPPQPPNAPQQQPVAQGHPGAQPGAAPGGAMAPDDEEEAAVQGGDVTQFRAREEVPWPPAAAAGTLTAGALLGVAVARRRRASRVRAQW